MVPAARHRRFLSRSLPENRRIADILRKETVGGALLLAATVAALAWANSPFGDHYESMVRAAFGPQSLHLHLTVESWAADGLLAIFFFLAGMEVKREFVAGDLHDPRKAALPVIAAIAGMATPAMVYLAINATAISGATGDASGWAIPTATDIAFALAVLAVIGSHLPSALRTFLLTLAVVDDLLAIIIIAIFFTDDLKILPAALAVIPLAIFGVLVQRHIVVPWLLLPLAGVAWGLVHASGIHATVAGVVLGFLVPVITRDQVDGSKSQIDANGHCHSTNGGIHQPIDAGVGVDADDPTKVGAATGHSNDSGRIEPGLAERLEHRWRPLSAGLAVPVFAFTASGVNIGGWQGFTAAVDDPVTVGVIAGLVLGKTVGVFLGTFATAHLTQAELDENISWIDIFGIAVLAGIGFTVSLLIGALAFGPGSATDERVKVGVLVGSLLAALLATIVLRARDRHYQSVNEE